MCNTNNQFKHRGRIYDIDFSSLCNCGAVTVQLSGIHTHYAMPVRQFRESTYNHRIKNKTYCCDYCVNKYGVNLCACGSGEAPDKCENGFEECGTPMQTIGQEHETFCKF